MIPIISATQMEKLIEESIALHDMKPMLFLGKTGIGKTALTENVTKKMGIGHIDIRILNHTETDFKGLPYPDKEREFTVYLQNKMLPIAERDGERGLLVFDEVTSGYKSVRTAIYQLLQERCIGDYKLPDGWQIICLGNGESDGGDFNGMESAFGARCKCFRVESITDDYLKYGNATGVNDLVLSFLGFSPSSLHTYNSEFDGTEECLGFSCNRAWSSVSDILIRKNINMQEGELSELDKLNIRGTLGEVEGMKFIAFVNLKREVVSAIDIAKGKKVVAPKRPEVLYMTSNSLKDIMVEYADSSERTELEKMEVIANVLSWLITNTSIELTASAIVGFCHKSNNGSDIFLSDEFEEYTDSIKKFECINQFFNTNSNLFQSV